ncbi:hypothetical protein [Hydrogenovibrio thermophilus]|uniref:Uncharacterized protein n=1 Tax=Hydrogenovibrio thermophilus TaxID=265883 RepID=A0A410H2G7_9GAMM|nr:hypothetical protein [Hydrogenovibrio thermophilus]QAB15115.1 hypothetical protein EPV75_05240 [Hydrogenovibrio thermophilus]
MEIQENETKTEAFEADLSFKSFTVDVNAKSGWKDTGIEVREGEIIRMEWYSGTWRGDVGMTNCPKHGPAGPTCDAYTALAGYPLPGVVEDSLVGKVGNDVFFVGEQLRKISRTNGRLHLTINDTGHHDNDGVITMKVSIGRR